MDDDTVSVDEFDPPAGRRIVAGLRDAKIPEGVDVTERDTGPKSAFRLVTLMVEVPETTGENSARLRLGGLLEMVKSGEEVLKNSVMGIAFASFEARLARFQLASIVLVKE